MGRARNLVLTTATDTPIGRDVDLDAEDVRLPDGTRLTTPSTSIQQAGRGARGKPSGATRCRSLSTRPTHGRAGW